MLWWTCALLNVAAGAEVAVVGLHVAEWDAAEAEAVGNRLAGALERHPGLESVQPEDVRARLQERTSLILDELYHRRGLELLREGRFLYERADLEAAAPLLDRAVQELESGLIDAGSAADLVDTLLLLAVTRDALGEPVAARAALARVITLQPHRELDPLNFPPAMVALHASVREELLAHGSARLEVAATPTTTVVVVDGIERGLAPLIVDDLVPGQHHITAVNAAGARSLSVVALQAGETLELALAFDRRLPATGSPEQTSLLYQAIGRHARADFLLLGGTLEGGLLALQLYDTRSRAFSEAVTVRPSGSVASAAVVLAEELAASVTDEGALRAERVSVVPLELDLNANAVLLEILLDPGREVRGSLAPASPTTVAIVPEPRKRWGLLAGAATGAAAAIVAGTVVAMNAGPADTTGTVIVGPVP